MKNNLRIMINCHNINGSGGLQVSDSVCRQLNRFSQHQFVLVLSHFLNKTAETVKNYSNVVIYNIESGKLRVGDLLIGRNKLLDDIVKNENIDIVLTIFGPSMWKPKVPHLCGFARGHFVLFDSPYYQIIGKKNALLEKIKYKLIAYYFKRNSKYLYTENPFITNKLKKMISGVKVFTVTNYYHQVFDQPHNWEIMHLPNFDGVTLLTLSETYPHKNLGIMVNIANICKNKYPEFKFRFVVTTDKNRFPYSIDGVEDYFLFIGKVHVNKCPSLYQQSDIMFMPTLMECFTATYPEAMRMGIPIVTTDLEFAHGLCGDAACYYSALDAEAAAECIYKVSTDKEYANNLCRIGKKQLMKFDSYTQRVDKLISICEKIVTEYA